MEHKRKSWDDYFIELAWKVSERSKDPSTKVGAVIVRPDHTVCSVGYNGFPGKMQDREEWYTNREEKYSRVIHAEINALIHARERIEGYTLYNTLQPCDRCSVVLIEAGIIRVVNPSPTEDALTRWKDALERTKKYYRECGIEYREI